MDTPAKKTDTLLNASVNPATPTANFTRYVEKYQTHSRNSSEALIELAKTVYDAERELLDESLQQFYREVNLVQKSATHKKLVVIGSRHGEFQDLCEHLPKTWTLLASIASMKDEHRKRAMASTIIHPWMTAANLTALKKQVSGKAASPHQVVLDLETLSERDRQLIESHIGSLRERFGLRKIA